MNKIFSDLQINWLKKNIPGQLYSKTIADFNKEFNTDLLTYSRLSSFTSTYGVKSRKINKYEKKHIDFIKKNVPGNTDKEVAILFNNEFDIKINDGIVSNFKTKYGWSNGLISSTRFKKGKVPLNKGKTWNDFMSKEGQEKSAMTTFKKGNVPSNRREIHSSRVSKDGYIEIKLRDGSLNKNWVYKHRHIWQLAHGPVPEGHKIVFADGNKRNFQLDNLILMNNAEEVMLNKASLLNSKSAEVTRVALTFVKLKRKTISLMNQGGRR